ARLALAALAPALRSQRQEDSLPALACGCVRIALANLKGDYRQVLWSLEVEGIDAGAFAGRLGITANNARVRAHRARQALRRELLKICGPCFERGCLDCDCPQRRRAPAGARQRL
ncbi:MAG: RNA polymerase sigma factor, partial [Thermoanaerobaculia bacterium]